jgi:hypothetical protein
MPNIFARSPYLIRIAETGQQGSKVELFISNSTFSTNPQWVLTKLIPASNNLETLYDISNYIREYISFNAISTSGDSAVTTPSAQLANVRVKRYKLVSGTYTLLDTIDYLAFDGYSYYEQGALYDLGNYGLDQSNYYYLNTKYAGKLRATVGAGFYAKYTNLVTTVQTTITMASANTYDLPRVRTANQNDGNILEIFNASNVLQARYYFYPIEECKYTPITIDFVNKYGAWQREIFFKASNDSFAVENTEYNLLQSNVYNYNTLEGQRKTFNTNGKKSIKVNTGWVNESWKETLKQIMLSERILIDLYPAKLNTKSTELFKSINTRQINYSLDFELAYDTINSVV